MSRRRSKQAARGAHALQQRVNELCGPELVNFMRDTLGVEQGMAEAWMRVELMRVAQDVFCEWAQAEMRLACGLAMKLQQEDADEEDDA